MTTILAVTMWVLGWFIRPLLWAEGKVFRAWERRQPALGKHHAGGGELDWLPPTPFVVNDACPECGSDEFPLSVYDGLRMCPVCKDEAIITDRTFGSTSTRMDALTPARLAELDGQLSLLTDGAYEVSHP